MAEFRGFGYLSPQEIQAQMAQQFSQAMASGNPNAVRAAVGAQAGLNFANQTFGSPLLNKAKKTEKVLNDAYKMSQDSATGDEVEDQIKFYAEAQKAAIDAELPEIAVQATEQLSQLRLIQEERSRLKAQEGRAVAQEERDKSAFDLQMEVDRVSKRHLTQGLLIDPQTLEVLDRGDLTNPDDLARLSSLQKERPGTVLRTESEFVELSEAEKDRKARLNRLGNGLAGRSTLYKKFYEKTQATDAFATTADDFVDLLLLDEAEVVFAGGGQARGLLQRAAANAKSFLGDEGSAGVEEALARDSRWNTLSEDKKALALELGYALATSREGGRLTDQDVERAMRTLGVDNPDPRAVAWIFGRAMKRTRDNYERSLITSGVDDQDSVREAYDMTLNALNASLERLESKYNIDFDDSTQFDQIIKPTSDNARLGETGTRVRRVGAGRNQPPVRDFTQ